MRNADHLFTNGAIFTSGRYVEALYVENGRVVAVGTDDHARAAAATGAERTDLDGHLLIPGLVDSHLHLTEIAWQRFGVELRDASSIAMIQERASEWARAHPNGPIVGRGWDQERLSDHRMPTRVDLDQISSDRPILMARACGHAAVVNSRALELVGIGRSSPDPLGGRIGRDPSGDPDGRLFDTAWESAASRIGRGTRPDAHALEAVLHEAAAFGLTTVVAMSAEAEEVEEVRRLAEGGRLPVRVRSFLMLEERHALDRLRRLRPTEDARLTGLKAKTDGSFGARTAWLEEAYSDRPEDIGVPVWTDDELREGLAIAGSSQLIPAFHAIGDRALARVLRLFASRPSGSLNRVEHASLVPETMRRTLRGIRPTLVVQPGFVVSDWWLASRLGSDRARDAYPFGALMEDGHLLAGSSDAPFDLFDPWVGIRAAVDRCDAQGRSANPDPSQRLSIEQALQMYTRNGGRAIAEPAIGTLEPGAFADLAILNVTSADQILTFPRAIVHSTWKAGRRVYQAPSTSSS